jgi:hypothetical protein
MALKRSRTRVIVAGLILSLLIVLGGTALASRRSTNPPASHSGATYVDMGPAAGSSQPAP